MNATRHSAFCDVSQEELLDVASSDAWRRSFPRYFFYSSLPRMEKETDTPCGKQATDIDGGKACNVSSILCFV